MARYFKHDDPPVERKRFGIEIQEEQCPGLLAFLESMPFGFETPTIRSVFYQWFLKHEQDGTLQAALESALNGPGGLLDRRRSPVRAGVPRSSARQQVGKTPKPVRRVAITPTLVASVPDGMAAPVGAIQASPPPNGNGGTVAPVAAPVVSIPHQDIPSPNVPAALESVAPVSPDHATGTGHEVVSDPEDHSNISAAQLDILNNLENMLGI